MFFVLYINDLHRAIDNAITRLFADDTPLLMYNKDPDTLVHKLSLTFQKLSRWYMVNKSIISIKKTNFVLFHTPNKPLVRDLREITTGNVVIKRVYMVKYLGVTTDEKLRWNADVEYACNSLIKFFGIFIQLRHKVITYTVPQLFRAFINSKNKKWS